MSNRQERIARKIAQREGRDAYVHLKPTAATPPEERTIRVVGERFGGDSLGSRFPRPSKRHLKSLGLTVDRKEQEA